MNNDKKPGFDQAPRPGAAQPAPTNAPQGPDPKAWPAEVADITYPSAADGTMQPMRFYAPPTDRRVPLLVYLHPWSCSYQFADNIFYARWCMERQWAVCFPDFRGPNLSPPTCGSELVVQDILSAVEYARQHAAIDANRIQLMGASGGGYAALLMAGRAPDLWAGVSAWVPIYDLKDWYFHCKAKGAGYYRQMETICGGPPGAAPAVDEEYRKRSASAWLPRATNPIIDISSGIHDTAIPVSHTLRAFNVLALPEDRVDKADMEFIDQRQQIPGRLRQAVSDPHRGNTGPLVPENLPNRSAKLVNELTPDEFAERVLFRRCSGRDTISWPALEFLSRQEKGKPPVWA